MMVFGDSYTNPWKMRNAAKRFCEKKRKFNEDLDKKIPLKDIDFIELSQNMEYYEVHFKNSLAVHIYRATKTILFLKDHVEIG